jgi:hypothetical protein
MPVDRNSHSGVCRVMAGSRIAARGIVSGCASFSLTLVVSLVTPANALNSPPEIVVGTLICRTVGAIGAVTLRTRSMSAVLVMSLARQICTALAPSVIEPPPTVTMMSAWTARACPAAAMTALRGVCAGIASNTPAQRLPSASLIFAISSVVRFSVPDTISSARCAPIRSNCSVTAAAAGWP